ncbi:MAG: hypothetical protein FWE74_05890 [Oscillospiraceae bacterium]|nr:hypothetical protein [Oscillospiraceae bacterium]
MQKHSRRRVINALRSGNELNIRIGQGASDVDVIATVSGEAVNLVDYDIIHAVFVLLDKFKHFLKLRSVGGARGRPSVNKFLADNRTH